MTLNEFLKKHPEIKVKELAKMMYGKPTSAQMLNQKLKGFEGATGTYRITENDLEKAKNAIKTISENLLSDIDSLTTS